MTAYRMQLVAKDENGVFQSVSYGEGGEVEFSFEPDPNSRRILVQAMQGFLPLIPPKVRTAEWATQHMAIALDGLTDDQRLKVIHAIEAAYCVSCGKVQTQPPCTCWNDE